MQNLPEDDEFSLLKKRNRLKKLSPKLHKIAHESGRSTKTLWSQILKRSKSVRKKGAKAK